MPLQPVFVAKGQPTVSRTISEVTFDASGLKPVVKAECQRVDTEYYNCASAESPARQCPRKRKQVLQCEESSLIVRAPWGGMYEGTTDAIPIPWKEVKIDPLSAEAPGILGGRWRIQTADGALDHGFVPAGSMVTSMLAAIVGALDAEHGVESPAGRTDLKLRFVDAGAPNRLALEVTNVGDVPAYQVGARLRTGFGPLHGAEALLGRIGPRQSKIWRKEIPVPDGGEEMSPMILAEVHASNAPAITASSRFSIVKQDKAPPARELSSLDALKIDCQIRDPKVVPGSRAFVRCKLQNRSKAPLRGLSYEIAIGAGKPVPGIGPAEIPSGGQVEISFGLSIPAEAKVGAKLLLVAAVKDKSGALRSAVPIEISAATQGLCTRLTRDEYRAKRKELEALLAQGGLTQADFDRYDAQLVACLQ